MKTTKQDIQQKAVELFNKKSYETVSVDEICKECGVSKGSFYHHFSSKEELLFSYWDVSYLSVDMHISQLFEIESPKERLWTAFLWSVNDIQTVIGKKAMKELWLADIKRGNTLFNPYQYQTSEGVRHYTQILNDLLNNAKAAGEIHNPADNESILFSLYSGVICLKLYWACQDDSYDLVKECRKIFDTILY